MSQGNTAINFAGFDSNVKASNKAMPITDPTKIVSMTNFYRELYNSVVNNHEVDQAVKDHYMKMIINYTTILEMFNKNTFENYGIFNHSSSLDMGIGKLVSQTLKPQAKVVPIASKQKNAYVAETSKVEEMAKEKDAEKQNVEQKIEPIYDERHASLLNVNKTWDLECAAISKVQKVIIEKLNNDKESTAISVARIFLRKRHNDLGLLGVDITKDAEGKKLITQNKVGPEPAANTWLKILKEKRYDDAQSYVEGLLVDNFAQFIEKGDAKDKSNHKKEETKVEKPKVEKQEKPELSIEEQIENATATQNNELVTFRSTQERIEKELSKENPDLKYVDEQIKLFIGIKGYAMNDNIIIQWGNLLKQKQFEQASEFIEKRIKAAFPIPENKPEDKKEAKVIEHPASKERGNYEKTKQKIAEKAQLKVQKNESTEKPTYDTNQTVDQLRIRIYDALRVFNTNRNNENNKALKALRSEARQLMANTDSELRCKELKDKDKKYSLDAFNIWYQKVQADERADAKKNLLKASSGKIRIKNMVDTVHTLIDKDKEDQIDKVVKPHFVDKKSLVFERSEPMTEDEFNTWIIDVVTKYKERRFATEEPEKESKVDDKSIARVLHSLPWGTKSIKREDQRKEFIKELEKGGNTEEEIAVILGILNDHKINKIKKNLLIHSIERYEKDNSEQETEEKESKPKKDLIYFNKLEKLCDKDDITKNGLEKFKNNVNVEKKSKSLFHWGRELREKMSNEKEFSKIFQTAVLHLKMETEPCALEWNTEVSPEINAEMLYNTFNSDYKRRESNRKAAQAAKEENTEEVASDTEKEESEEVVEKVTDGESTETTSKASSFEDKHKDLISLKNLHNDPKKADNIYLKDRIEKALLDEDCENIEQVIKLVEKRFDSFLTLFKKKSAYEKAKDLVNNTIKERDSLKQFRIDSDPQKK